MAAEPNDVTTPEPDADSTRRTALSAFLEEWESENGAITAEELTRAHRALGAMSDELPKPPPHPNRW